MSICIVAKYPWQAVEPLAAGEPSGVVVCNDTRVTRGKVPVPTVILSKQLELGRNMAVCYTSSNLFATSRAFAESFRTRDLRKVGDSLRSTHQDFGGATELLAVVWRRGRDPQILEVMPPKYQPKPRSGILGIGDPGVLNWFQENFCPIIRPPTPVLSASAIESLQSTIGGAIDPPRSRFNINDAGLQIATAFTEAIAGGGGPTVGLPIQYLIFTAAGIRRLGMAGSDDEGSSWSTITADPSALSFPKWERNKTQQDPSPRTARQLFP